MKLEGTIHCEGPDCRSHQHVGSDTMEAGRLPVGWVRVTEFGGSSDPQFAYCTWECLMKSAAQLPPPEHYDMEGNRIDVEGNRLDDGPARDDSQDNPS